MALERKMAELEEQRRQRQLTADKEAEEAAKLRAAAYAQTCYYS